jgi:hypothetical protein
MMDDGRFDPEKLRMMSNEAAAKLHTGAKGAVPAMTKLRCAGATERFARMPLEWTAQMSKVLNSAEQMSALIHLVNQATFSSDPIPATSRTTGGVSTHVRRQTLRLLEAAGVASVQRRERGKSSLVTLFIGKPPVRR